MDHRPAPLVEEAAVAIAVGQKEAPGTAPGVVAPPVPAEPDLGPTPSTAALVVALAVAVVAPAVAVVAPKWHCRAARQHSAVERRQLDFAVAEVLAVVAAGLVE